MFFQRAEELPVVLYGKLPLAKDYLRLGFGAGSPQRFRDWLDRSYSGQGSVPVLAGPMEFVGGAEWGPGLIGVTCPSSDAGGLRPFPFVLAVERKPKRIARDWARGLRTAAAIHDSLLGIFATLDQPEDGRTLLEGLRGRTIEVEESNGPEANESERISFEAWIDAAFPGRGRAGLEACLDEIVRLAGAGHRGPLRLPLVPNLPMRPQARAWCLVAERLGAIDFAQPPALFYPAVTGAACEGWSACFFFREPPRTEHAQWLQPDGPGTAVSGDLWGDGPVPAPERGVPEEAPPLVDSLRGVVARRAPPR